MKLRRIPEEDYDDYRLDLMFKGYKWDPQFSDHNTVSKHILVLSEEENDQLIRYVEALSLETAAAEIVILANPKLAKPLALPWRIRKDARRMTNYNQDQHIRLMRFDFHPLVSGGWAISEVNSDVPGGFAESSIMPEIAASLFPEDKYTFHSFGRSLLEAVVSKVKSGATIMLVHCTSYSDDRQVMQFLGDQLESLGYHPVYGAADHVRFEGNQAYSLLDNNEGSIDAIIRFTPLEWLIEMKPKRWQGYFTTTTPCCNHPIAIYTQSKNFPLIFDALEAKGVSLSTWRTLLPKTTTLKKARHDSGYIYKPIWGRVGEGITIKEACQPEEYLKLMRDIKRHPRRYLAQKKFSSQPLMAEGEAYHVCLGAYSINGKAAGYYARVSRTPRIDSSAADIPVLVERGDHDC